MVYRIISCSADTYITDKFIESSRSLTSNVGNAGTLDLFTLYNETSLPGVTGTIREVSRALIKFDYNEFKNIDTSNPTFTSSIVLKDVYGGQTTPSNFTLVAYPLSKSFNEGRGFDIVSFKDLDTANFLSANTTVSWSITGANDLGSLGDDCDVIVSGNIGSGLENLGSFVTFTRGDEDAVFNITKIVSASLAGILPNNGFRISFIENEETDTTTRFVKRFGSRHALNKGLHPKMHVKLSDRIYDTSGTPTFNVSQSFYTYNIIAGQKTNFISSSIEITGSNSLLFELVSSKSVSFTTSSYQANFESVITHLTRSVVYFSASFTASQYNNDTGIYNVDLNLDLTNNSELNTFVDGRNSVYFDGTWKSLDGNTTFAKKGFLFKRVLGTSINVLEKNYIVNAVNLKSIYTKNEQPKIKVFVQDKSLPPRVLNYKSGIQPTIVKDMRWRIVKPYTTYVKHHKNNIVIPFSEATKMSTDCDGMYFDLFVKDLDVNEVYELEFLIKNEGEGEDLVIQNKGFIFKVIE